MKIAQKLFKEIPSFKGKIDLMDCIIDAAKLADKMKFDLEEDTRESNQDTIS